MPPLSSLLPESGTSPPESGTAVCTFFTKGLCEKGEWAEVRAGRLTLARTGVLDLHVRKGRWEGA